MNEMIADIIAYKLLLENLEATLSLNYIIPGMHSASTKMLDSYTDFFAIFLKQPYNSE